MSCTGSCLNFLQIAEQTEEEQKKRRQQAKERLKERFNADYDETNQHYNALKEELDAQAKVSAVEGRSDASLTSCS